ncbi:hypothetical protein E2C01_045601 [Portunus trituberculatus]|uniref:Uncharacterized protein n=1 Tax=Portunus trituberculatus TaxID=210409 RepID=A0A5B7G2I2_PORTR|nr:hypothetical protein [Portunus trituberculatus]
MQYNVVFSTLWYTGIRYTSITVSPVLPVIQYHSGTVAAARREMTELCIRPNVRSFDYQIFSPLISLWC